MHDNQENMFDIMQRLGLDSIDTQIQTRRLRWLGRIATFPPGRWENIALTGALSPEWQYKKKNGGQNNVGASYLQERHLQDHVTQQFPRRIGNDAWRNLAQDTVRWKRLTKKWLAKQRQEEKTKYGASRLRLHLEEKHSTEQKSNVVTNNEQQKRILRLMRPEELSVLIADQNSRLENSLSTGRSAATFPARKGTDKTTAQPLPVAQPEQQPLEQQEDEIEWRNVMNEVDAIFSEPVAAPHPEQRDRAAPSNQARGKWRNMSAMPAPKRPAGQNPLECTFCHSGFPKADKCAIHMRTCAAMPYDMWIARVRLSSLCPDYAEHACPHCGTKFTTSKGCNAHANQCRKRREKSGTTHGHMSLAQHSRECGAIMMTCAKFWLSST